MDFYTGRVLRINLSHTQATVEPLNVDWARLYLGGKGLLLRYLWDEVAPGIDPWSPENPLIVMTGPFAGTGVTTGSRMYIGCKSPVTGILNDSCVGGSFGPELKFAGYDAVIIEGRAAAPTYIAIRDDVVDFRSAVKCRGMRTSQVEEMVRKDFDRRAKVLSIGPAGENEVPWACISCDQYHKAGRGGHGALMGNKNLKAIAVRGSGAVDVGDAKSFLALMLDMQADVLTADNLWAYEEGTPIFVDPVNEGGALPTRNWSAGSFEGAERINSSAFQQLRIKKRACYQCVLGCRNVHRAEYQGTRVLGEGPEYETIALCGANCGIDDIAALMKFNAECDEWGLDTISSGAVLALAMDMTEKGIADFGVHFGETDTYVEVPRMVALREGVGSELALGARALAAKYGHPELAMEVKALELPGYDPRGAFGMSVAYATADRGGCHMRATTVGPEIISRSMSPHSLTGKVEYCVAKQNFKAVKFSAVFCDFWAVTSGQIRTLLERLHKRAFTDEQVNEIGDRVWNLGRLFNLREGVEVDDIPAALYERVAPSRSPAPAPIGRAAFVDALRDYYRLRQWDEDGIPSEAKLDALGIDVRLPSGPPCSMPGLPRPSEIHRQ